MEKIIQKEHKQQQRKLGSSDFTIGVELKRRNNTVKS
jgi:hypothetical protein